MSGERVDVAACVDGPFAERLLGTHLPRGAEAESCLRQMLSAGLLDGERDAEIRDARVSALKEDVLGLMSRRMTPS